MTKKSRTNYKREFKQEGVRLVKTRQQGLLWGAGANPMITEQIEISSLTCFWVTFHKRH